MMSNEKKTNKSSDQGVKDSPELDLHDPLMREKDEPKEGFAPTPTPGGNSTNPTPLPTPVPTAANGTFAPTPVPTGPGAWVDGNKYDDKTDTGTPIQQITAANTVCPTDGACNTYNTRPFKVGDCRMEFRVGSATFASIIGDEIQCPIAGRKISRKTMITY